MVPLLRFALARRCGAANRSGWNGRRGRRTQRLQVHTEQMPKLRDLTQDLLYPTMGLVSFAYFTTHQHVFIGLIALLLTILYVVKSTRLRKQRAAELQEKGEDSH